MLLCCGVGLASPDLQPSDDEGRDFSHLLASNLDQDPATTDFPESTQDGVEVDGIPAPPVADDSWLTWFWDNSDNILGIFIAIYGLIGIIVRLTPTTKDDLWYTWFGKLIPNRKKGGGSFP